MRVGVMMDTSRGFALVFVLWIAIILALVAAGISQTARQNGQTAFHAENAVQLRYRLSASIDRAIWDLMAARPPAPFDPSRLWADGKVHSFGQNVRVRMIQANGLIDVNSANSSIFQALINQAANSVKDPASIVEAATNLRASKRIFNVIDLANTIPDPAGRALILSTATVSSGRTAPDPTLAPAEVLALFPGLTKASAFEILEARTSPGSVVTIPGLAEQTDWISEQGPDVPRGTVYHVHVAVRNDDGARHGEWISLFLPLPEGRNVMPYMVLERHHLAADDPFIQALFDEDQP